jgi:hypothetical protein
MVYGRWGRYEVSKNGRRRGANERAGRGEGLSRSHASRTSAVDGRVSGVNDAMSLGVNCGRKMSRSRSRSRSRMFRVFWVAGRS